MSLLVKGIRGRSGWGMGIKGHYLYWGNWGETPVSYPPPPAGTHGQSRLKLKIPEDVSAISATS
jgi:hypothetical protein